jgi:hypothetical protein
MVVAFDHDDVDPSRLDAAIELFDPTDDFKMGKDGAEPLNESLIATEKKHPFSATSVPVWSLRAQAYHIPARSHLEHAPVAGRCRNGTLLPLARIRSGPAFGL